jgi:hypothetical protein
MNSVTTLMTSRNTAGLIDAANQFECSKEGLKLNRRKVNWNDLIPPE